MQQSLLAEPPGTVQSMPELTSEIGGAGQSVADMVVAADGPSSTIRRLLEPEVERKYVGYVAWRGTCPETQLSDIAREQFVEKFTFFHTTGNKILGYF